MSSNESAQTAAPAPLDLKRIPATITLIVLNVLVFVITYWKAGSAEGAAFTVTLLEMGAQFNPLTLDKEWYRIFTHMFLHGGLMHLGFNMYALYVVGSEIEVMVGSRKFVAVYFISGIASALNSLYWSFFSVGVGASGAIFGLFGFSLIINIFLSRRHGKSMMPLLINFAVFIGINLLIAKSINADNAAHFGGLTAGLLIGLYAMITGGGPSFTKVRVEFILLPLLVVVYFALPRYQVSYYQFFQRVLAAEDSTQSRLRNGMSREQYADVFNRNIQDWDTALVMLDRQLYLPSKLSGDTTRLRKYIQLRKKENHFKKLMVEEDNSAYGDSVTLLREQMEPNLELDYPLSFRLPARQE
jgi:membrane associated rhomboid family serine protease